VEGKQEGARVNGIAPAVSILMPVYNAERYVAEAVESILTQTFRDFEFLIIDDGSTDRSLQILRKYERQDARIRLFSRANTGYVVALNEMLAFARGEFIARMDADDVSEPQRLGMQVDYLKTHADIVCLGSLELMMDERGRLIGTESWPHDDERIQARLLDGFMCICHSAVTMRKAAVARAGGYDETLTGGEDHDLWLRLGEIGKLCNLAAPLVRYRIHSKSVSGTLGERQFEIWRSNCERAWKRRGITGTFRPVGPWRPGPDRQSQLAAHLRHGWTGFNNRYRNTALAFGVRAVRLCPFSSDAWRLVICSLVK
jgi:glycosyltransferase involved in cell wall biosynthesis